MALALHHEDPRRQLRCKTGLMAKHTMTTTMGLVVTEVTTTPGTITPTIELFRDLMGPRAALRDPLVEVMVLLQSSLMIEAMPIMDDHPPAPTVVATTETGGHLQGRTARDRVSESDTCTTDFLSKC